MSELKSFGSDVEDAISRVRVPAYLIDKHGIIRWLNPAAQKLVGDVRGRQLTSVVAPEETLRARRIFTRNLLGPPDGSDNKACSSTRMASECPSRSARFRFAAVGT